MFAFVTVRKSFPDTSGEVRVNALRSEVTVQRDDKGIPQIYADNSEDLFFAQGYVHAQDRFFEMDFRRHVTAGRLAELVGDGALDTDKYVRTLGWRRVAEQEVELLDPETKALRRGVQPRRQLLHQRQVRLRAVARVHRPRAHRSRLPTGSVDAGRLTGVDQGHGMGSAQQHERRDHPGAVDQGPHGRRRSRSSIPTTPRTTTRSSPTTTPTSTAGTFEQDGATTPRDPVTLIAPALPDPGLARAAVASLEAAQSGADALPALLGIGDGIGSNSWVVDGDHSATGKPILANDPHLAPSMPGIWYQVGLHCRDASPRSARTTSPGFSFSGMPGVVVGHNKRVAWGVTTMYADVADLYLEKVTGDTYEYDGKQLPIETPPRDVQGRRRQDRAHHRAVDAARTDPVRPRRRHRRRRHQQDQGCAARARTRWRCAGPR